jgi:hypothetical protein
MEAEFIDKSFARTLQSAGSNWCDLLFEFDCMCLTSKPKSEFKIQKAHQLNRIK